MQMMRKRFWIIFGIVCASVVVLCSVFALVFRLKTVDVEFRTRVSEETNLPLGIQNQVKESGEFSYGKNIVFMNFNKNIEKIEKANPFVKVEQVIRTFPNIARIYISERIPKYRVQDENDSNSWYILDGEFKVLDKVSENELKLNNVFSGKANYFDRTIEISPDSFKISAYISDFVKSEENMKLLSNVLSGIYGATEDYFIANKISFNSNGYLEVTIKASGCRIIIDNFDNVKEKIYAGVFCYYQEIKDDTGLDLSNSYVRIEKLSDGRFLGHLIQE